MDSAIHCSNPKCGQCIHIIGSGVFDGNISTLSISNNGAALICARCAVATRIPTHVLNRMGLSIS